MLKRHEVEILLKAGHRKMEVARLTGVSLCSVKRMAQEGPVVHVDDAAERAQRKVGRPSTVVNFRKPVMEILQQTPDLASLEILRRVREAGYEGGKTALYALIASLRPKLAKPLVRFEGLAGEFSQHDFGQVEVEFRNGASQRIHFFASRLKYSRLMRVSLVKDEAVESLVRTLAEHLASWGGVPLQCVFDRPKTVALKWRKNGEVTEWNPVFAYATQIDLALLVAPFRAVSASFPNTFERLHKFLGSIGANHTTAAGERQWFEHAGKGDFPTGNELERVRVQGRSLEGRNIQPGIPQPLARAVFIAADVGRFWRMSPQAESMAGASTG